MGMRDALEHLVRENLEQRGGAGSPLGLAAASSVVRVDLEGMTCASCAARIERGLSKLDGVEASVSLATEQATVKTPPSVGIDDLVGAVRAVGYDARPAS